MKRTLREIVSNLALSRWLHDSRGSSVNIGFIIQVGITTIVIVGVISGMTGVVENEQNRAVDHQATVIGDQVAASAMAVDRMGNVGERTNVTLNRELPADVVGTPYIVRLLDGPDGPYIFVDVINQDASAQIPINVDADIKETSVSGGSKMVVIIEHDPSTGTAEIRLEPEEDGGLS